MYPLSIREIIENLSKREFSAQELTEHYLNKITSYDKHLNSFISIHPKMALEQAKNANSCKPLHGIPIAHKDIFCTKGIKTSCGSRMLDNFISPYDATIVEKLFDAGVIMLGKTNMDEFAMGSSNENSYYGAVKNPWNTDYVAGGSSGGSAAAVAAGFVPAATSTDTGGSIRQPAAFCGITGIKPTYGRVSRFGMIAFASSLDQAGIMAKSAEDCAYFLQYMAGSDPKDSTSVEVDVPNYIESLGTSLCGMTFGLPKEYMDSNLDSDVAQSVDDAIRVLQRCGAKIKSISLPNTHLSIPAYYVIAPAECSSNLARYDGVRYGYRCESPKDLQDMYMRSRSEGFGDEVKRRVMIGTYVLSTGFYDAYYVKAQKIRRLIADEFKSALNEVDAIIGPTTPGPAFKLNEKNDPLSMYLSDIYTCSVNLAGLPAISVPAGFVNNLPVGLQIIGNYFAEDKIFNIAHQFQQNTNWHQHQPNLEQL